jgi:hypothetical protein
MVEPIFKSVFGAEWEAMPPVLKAHYANRPFSNDVVVHEGLMDIKLSKLTKLIGPLFKLFGALVPYEGTNIPTTVYSRSEPDSANYILERHWHFPDRESYIFLSTLIPRGGSEVFELMRFGLGWLGDYRYNGEKVLLTHKSFCFRVFGKLIPIPLALFLGKGYAEEEVTGDNMFKMYVEMKHGIFGKTFEYRGEFKVE